MIRTSLQTVAGFARSGELTPFCIIPCKFWLSVLVPLTAEFVIQAPLEVLRHQLQEQHTRTRYKIFSSVRIHFDGNEGLLVHDAPTKAAHSLVLAGKDTKVLVQGFTGKTVCVLSCPFVVQIETRCVSRGRSTLNKLSSMAPR